MCQIDRHGCVIGNALLLAVRTLYSFYIGNDFKNSVVLL